MRNRALLKQALFIETITIAWMVVEGAVSLTAGIRASSVSLIAFGIDSLIELISAGFLLWRLQVEFQSKSGEADRAERIAGWGTAGALTALCLYIVAEAIMGFMHQTPSEASPIGIVIAVAAVLLMPWLAARKRKLAVELPSSALRADAACSITCAYLAAALLVGLVITAATGWWWIDTVITLLFLYWLIPETLEAIEGARSGRISCQCEEKIPSKSSQAQISLTK